MNNIINPVNISWYKVCTQNRLVIWALDIASNETSIGKIIWNINCKQDSQWTDRINGSRCMKGKDWWSFKPSRKASWAFRHTCYVKDSLFQFVSRGSLLPIQLECKRNLSLLQANQSGSLFWNKRTTYKFKFVSWRLAHQC